MAPRPYFGISPICYLDENISADNLSTAKRLLEQDVASHNKANKSHEHTIEIMSSIVRRGVPDREAIFPRQVLAEAGVKPGDGARRDGGLRDPLDLYATPTTVAKEKHSNPLETHRSPEDKHETSPAIRPNPSYLSLSGNPILPFRDPQARPIHYRSKSPFFMARFLKTIHRRPELAQRVVGLTFSLPNDGWSRSGVWKLMASMPPPPSKSKAKAALQPKSKQKPPPLPALVRAAEVLKLHLGLFKSPAHLPLKLILELYVCLFSVCANVQYVEIPWQWEEEFRLWEGVFPRVGNVVVVGSRDEEGEVAGGPGKGREGGQVGGRRRAVKGLGI